MTPPTPGEFGLGIRFVCPLLNPIFVLCLCSRFSQKEPCLTSRSSPLGQILMSASPPRVRLAHLVLMRLTDIAACVQQKGLDRTVRKVRLLRQLENPSKSRAHP